MLPKNPHLGGLDSFQPRSVEQEIDTMLTRSKMLMAIALSLRLDSYAFNRKQKYFNKSQAASISWMMLRMDSSALW